jgi:hypothetical protein
LQTTVAKPKISSSDYLHIKAENIFQSLKILKENEDMSFLKILNSLNLDESTYILSLKSKLIELHIF